MRTVTIQAIGTAVPTHRASQDSVAKWAMQVAEAQYSPAPEAERDRRRAHVAIDRIYRSSAIKRRASVLEDFNREPEDFAFFPQNWALHPSPSTAARMEVYRNEAPRLGHAAATDCLAKAPHIPRASVSHLIVVSCTGFYAPGLDIDLVRSLGLRRGVFRQVMGFMGCYGAFNGMRAARDICIADPEAVVLLVCVELCSIHYQAEYSPDTVVANCLFSDGAAAALITSEGSVKRGRFELVNSLTSIQDDSLDDMTWSIGDSGFRMTLAGTVPDVLRSAVGPFVDELLGRNGVDRSSVEFWAIHPGGRRIVEAICQALEIEGKGVECSLGVLADHGNMSSATILFVLDRLQPKPDAVGVAMAFGPGLTLESFLMKAVG